MSKYALLIADDFADFRLAQHFLQCMHEQEYCTEPELYAWLDKDTLESGLARTFPRNEELLKRAADAYDQLTKDKEEDKRLMLFLEVFERERVEELLNKAISRANSDVGYKIFSAE